MQQQVPSLWPALHFCAIIMVTILYMIYIYVQYIFKYHISEEQTRGQSASPCSCP